MPPTSVGKNLFKYAYVMAGTPMSEEPPPILFECLTADELARDRAWWRIYKDSFPANEREARQIILRSLQQGVGLAVAARSGNQTIGLATTHILLKPAAVFLVYLAMAQDWRGRGSGGALLEYIWRASAKRLAEQGLAPAGLIWEVDSPEHLVGAEETHHRERRIAFFRRHGGEFLSRPYVQPPVDGVAPVPMSLMYRAAEGFDRPDPTMSEKLVRAIYFEKYGAINDIPREVLERLL